MDNNSKKITLEQFLCDSLVGKEISIGRSKKFKKIIKATLVEKYDALVIYFDYLGDYIFLRLTDPIQIKENQDHVES